MPHGQYVVHKALQGLRLNTIPLPHAAPQCLLLKHCLGLKVSSVGQCLALPLVMVMLLLCGRHGAVLSLGLEAHWPLCHDMANLQVAM